MTSTLERCETSYSAQHGQCARWLLADALCDRPDDHWPQTLHRARTPYFLLQYIAKDDLARYFTEVDGRAVQVPNDQITRTVTIPLNGIIP